MRSRFQRLLPQPFAIITLAHEGCFSGRFVHFGNNESVCIVFTIETDDIIILFPGRIEFDIVAIGFSIRYFCKNVIRCRQSDRYNFVISSEASSFCRSQATTEARKATVANKIWYVLIIYLSFETLLSDN